MPYTFSTKSNGQIVEPAHINDIQAAITEMSAGVVNVLDHGATGDGSADDTADLQAIFTAINAGTIDAHTVYFPEGDYKLTAALTVNVNRIRIMGAGQWRTRLHQTTPNVPILLWSDANTPSENFWNYTSEAPGNGITVADLLLEFEDNPTALTTQQYGIQFRPNAAGDADNATGYSYLHLHRLSIRKCYRGVGVWSDTGTRLCPIWNSSFRDLVFIETLNEGISLRGGDSGCTSNVFYGITFSNWSRDDVGGVASTGPAIYANSLNGSILHGINLETWQNTGIELSGGYGNSLDAIRFEQHKFTGTGSALILSTCLDATIGSVSFQALNLANAGGTLVQLVYLFGSTTKASLERLFAEHTTGSGTASCFGGDVGAVLAHGYPTMSGNVIEYWDSGNGNHLYARAGKNGYIATVNALPTASSTYRGRLFTVRGGAGVADATYECRKNAADAYVWTAI